MKNDPLFGFKALLPPRVEAIPYIGPREPFANICPVTDSESGACFLWASSVK